MVMVSVGKVDVVPVFPFCAVKEVKVALALVKSNVVEVVPIEFVEPMSNAPRVFKAPVVVCTGSLKA